MFIYNMYVLK